jgi:hypothetical protein
MQKNRSETEEAMSQPLHTDDPARPGNVTADDYREQHERRARELGASGLHTIPADVLALVARDGDQ